MCVRISDDCINFHEESKRCFECSEDYYLNLSFRCENLPANCIFASPTGQCIDCKDGYEVGEKNCELKKIILPNC